MKDFLFRTYCTEYFAHSNEGFIKKMGREACFARVYRYLEKHKRSTIWYKIIIYRGIEFGKKTGRDNACLLSHKELRNHIDQLKGLIPFKCRIRDFEDKEGPKYEVNIVITDGTVLQHKYALAWIRYAYEFPFNVTLFESRKLREEKEFKFMSGFNLFNIVNQCLDIWGSGHSIAYDNRVLLKSRKSLAEKLKSKGLQVNDVFACARDLNGDHIGHRGKNKPFCITDIEYWEDNELYLEERLPIYKKRLKHLKSI